MTDHSLLKCCGNCFDYEETNKGCGICHFDHKFKMTSETKVCKYHTDIRIVENLDLEIW